MSPPGHARRSPAANFCIWLGLNLLLVAMLAFAAAHVTGQAGIACRFAPLFGLVTGAAIAAIVGPLAGQGGAAAWRRSLIAGLLGAAGFVGLTLEAYRQRVERLRPQYLQEPILGLTSQLPLNEARRIADEMRQARKAAFAADSTFRRHLHYRLTGDRAPDDRWSEPWPAVIWSVEIALAALAAAAGHHLFAHPRRTP